MQTATKVLMDASGALTIPAEIREELGMAGATVVEIEVIDGTLALRPSDDIPEDDAWAYTPEHRALLDRALREGDGRSLSEAELTRLIDE